MSTPRVRLSSRHWLGQTSAGVVLGFGLALSLSGLFAWWGPGGIHELGGKNQFNMWLMAPIWTLVLGFVYLFRDSVRAWAWLSLANLISFALLFLARSLSL